LNEARRRLRFRDEEELDPVSSALSIDQHGRRQGRVGRVGSEAAVNRLEQARSTPWGFGKGGRFGFRTTDHASWHVFRLYALDAELDLAAGAAMAELEQAISGHVLTTAELVGTNERGRPRE